MPDFPIIDTHLHVWDQTRLRYSAFDGHPVYGHPWHIEDYHAACGDVAVEAMVFLECYTDFTPEGGQYLEEIAFVEDEAARDPRILGIVPMAPVEWGARVEPLLRQMQQSHPKVKGIRRIVEFDADPRSLTLSDDFVAGVNLLTKFDWHFEINVNFRQMDIVHEFAARVPDVPLILDHCGKPGIAQGALEQFRADMAALALRPNTSIKLSGLPGYAAADWTEEDLRPYIAATLDTFGPTRTMFGSDWPIISTACTLPRWIAVLDRAFADLGLSQPESRAIWRDNANAFYRLGL